MKKILRNKFFIFGLIIVLGGVFYFSYQKSKANDNLPRYMTEAVKKGTLIISVSGTGQVAASSQVEIKPQNSGKVTSIKVSNGQIVEAGTVIAQLDAKDAQKSVRDANLNLQNARLSLQKLLKPTDSFTISQAKSDLEQARIDFIKLQKPPTAYDLSLAQNAIAQAQRDLEEAKNNNSKINLDTDQTLKKAYDDGYTAVSNAYLDIPEMVNTDLNNILWTQSGGLQDNTAYYRVILGQNSVFVKSLASEYESALKIFNDSFNHFKATLRTGDQEAQYKLLEETLIMAKAVSQALQSASNMFDAIGNQAKNNVFIGTTVDTYKPKIQTDIGIINKDITALQSVKDAIDAYNQNTPFDLKNSQATIITAEEKLEEKQAYLQELQTGPTREDLDTAKEKINQRENALNKLYSGADPLDIQLQELTITQRANALADAKQTLGDYVVLAPFDSVIDKMNIAKGDVISPSTVVATAVTEQLLSQISLNEVDIAKIKIGDKTTLTFDAIEELSITGQVAEIDMLGTVTQGVVTYNVKIAFDTQDERIKPGMSVSAAIITNIKQDILLVPNAAVKTQGDRHYVEMIDTSKKYTTANDGSITSTFSPRQQTVEIGLANDTETEILNNLKEGDEVIIRTIASGKTTTSPSTGSLGGIRIPGAGGGSGGNAAAGRTTIRTN